MLAQPPQKLGLTVLRESESAWLADLPPVSVLLESGLRPLLPGVTGPWIWSSFRLALVDGERPWQDAMF